MKTLLYIIIFNIGAISFAQDPQLFENDWYLQKIILDGQDIFPPNNSEIENVVLEILENPYYISTWACSVIGTDIILISNEYFEVNDFAIISNGCTLPETVLFENYYFNDFYDWQNPNTFNYVIEIGTNNEKQLILTNDLGNQAIYGDAPLSINTAEEKIFAIHPNPANDKLFISTTDITGNLIIKIFNIAGKLLDKQTLETASQTPLAISQLKSGIYFLNIEDENGNTTIQKFIKQ
ncbi:MAG: hypothetical protein COA40_04965 [Aequorivita sp.]|nr:MAG: hypothetical protein COA40_04965 [Aequorivita sp.]